MKNRWVGKTHSGNNGFGWRNTRREQCLECPPPVAQYWLGLDNDRVVDWCKDGPIVKKGRWYEIFIELTSRGS